MEKEDIIAQIKQDENIYAITMSTFILTFGLLFYPIRYYLFMFLNLKTIVLLSIRFRLYKQKKWHYCFFDYCYMVVLMMILIRVFGITSFYLLSTFFILALGPLSTAFFLYLYRIVFHDTESYTSFFMHIAPCLTAWIIRFHILEPQYSLGLPLRSEWDAWIASLSFAGKLLILVLPVLVYLTWNVVYYILIFRVLEKRIERNKYVTLYSYTKETSAILNRFFNDNEEHNRMVYMMSHALLSVAGILWAYFLFFTRYITFAYIIMLVFKPIWTSGVYYHYFFGKKVGSEEEETEESDKKDK